MTPTWLKFSGFSRHNFAVGDVITLRWSPRSQQGKENGPCYDVVLISTSHVEYLVLRDSTPFAIERIDDIGGNCDSTLPVQYKYTDPEIVDQLLALSALLPPNTPLLCPKTGKLTYGEVR